MAITPIDDIRRHFTDAWLEITVVGALGLGLGALIGAKIAAGSATKRERAACDTRVAAAQKESRRLGVVDARKAVDATLNELAARQNPYEITRGGRQVPVGGTIPSRRDANAMIRYLEASEGPGGKYRVRNLAKRRRRS